MQPCRSGAGSPRPSGRCAVTRLSRSSSKLTRSAFEIEERDLLELVALARPRTAACSEAARDRASAQSGDHRIAVEHDARQRLAHAVGHDAAQARPQGIFPARRRASHAAAPRAARRAGTAGTSRSKPSRLREPSRAHLVDDFLNRAVHRAQRDDDRLGVLGAVACGSSPPDSRPNPSRTRRRAAESAPRARSCLWCDR